MIDLLELKTAAWLAVAFTILGEASQKTKHLQRNEILLLQLPPKPRRQSREIQILPTTVFCIWSQFAERLEQRPL
ncbi:hypothetical protein D9M69_530810 [compost metagenome]